MKLLEVSLNPKLVFKLRGIVDFKDNSVTYEASANGAAFFRSSNYVEAVEAFDSAVETNQAMLAKAH